MPSTYASEIAKATAVESFWNGFNEYMDPFDGLIYSRDSTQETDTYARLGSPAFPRHWQGDRDYKDLNEYSYTLTNRPYEASIRIDKKFIKFQQWDEIAKSAAEQGMKARMHTVSLHTTDLDNGNATAGDDAQFFFDTDHTDPGAEYTTSQDNDLTSNITDPDEPTDIEFRDALAGMFDALFGFKDDRGDPFAVPSDAGENFILMLPTNLRAHGDRHATSDNLDTGSGTVGNQHRGKFVPRVNQFMTTSTTNVVMYLLYAGSSHKPLIKQSVAGVQMETRIEPVSGDILIETDWWGRTGYGQWRVAVRHEFT